VMLLNVGVCISFSIILFIIIINFFSKKRISKYENTIFVCLVLLTDLGLSIVIFIYIVVLYLRPQFSFLLKPLVKSLYIYYVLWMYLFVSYNLFLLKEKNLKKRKNIFLIIIYGLFFLLSLLLPFNLEITESYFYPPGIGSYAQYIFGIVGFIIIGINSFKNFKKLKNKKFIPLIVCTILGISASVLQYFKHEFMFIVPSNAIGVILMYFTIENPDLKILEEYTRNKKLTEENIEARTNLLFKITEDVKNPVKKIKHYSDNILNTNIVEEKNLNAVNILVTSKDLLNNVNDVLNISRMDKGRIKVFDTTYDVYKLYNQIVYIIKNKIGSNIDFKYSVSDIIPNILFGDASRIKQIICSLILNDYKNANQGVIDLDIYSIVKYDVCRLVITVQSSMRKLTLFEINEILSSNIEVDNNKIKELSELDFDLKLIKKLVDILDGTLLITSDEKGTIFKVVLNQLIKEDETSKKLDLISNKLSNKKRVLLVNDDYQELIKIANELKRNNYDVTSIMHGEDCILRLKKGDKYNLLLLDDELIEETIITLIKEIDELNIEDIVKIIMLDKKKESLKEHYMEKYSFKDYLLKDKYKEEIQRIKNKY